MKSRNNKRLAFAAILVLMVILAGCSPSTDDEASIEEAVTSDREEVAMEAPDADEPDRDQSDMETLDPDEADLEEPVSVEPAEEAPGADEPALTTPETPVEPAPVPEPSPAPTPEPEPEPQVALSGSLVNGVREIQVLSSQFDFIPGDIVVRQGEEVRLLLTTADVAHGIGLSQFGINARIPAGETTVVTFTAHTVGEFTIVCTVPCGPGHGSMTGQLVVI
ncbi:MAG: hypothetical protein SCK57_12610 [Bacillota bacterium]|nr:hypothetical protein [Bacillota bacterium]